MAADTDRGTSLVEGLKDEAVVDQLLQIPTLVGLVDEHVKPLHEQVSSLDARIQTYEEKVLTEEPRTLNFIVVGLVVPLTAFLVIRGWAETPTVSIEFNVGEVISGILVGTAALLASASYRRLSRLE